MASGAPTQEELTSAIAALIQEFGVVHWYDEEEIDIRLQVVDGGWALHTGDPQYDTDHRGQWGYGTLTPETEPGELAEELLNEISDEDDEDEEAEA